jgi:hypothetical protein
MHEIFSAFSIAFGVKFICLSLTPKDGFLTFSHFPLKELYYLARGHPFARNARRISCLQQF